MSDARYISALWKKKPKSACGAILFLLLAGFFPAVLILPPNAAAALKVRQAGVSVAEACNPRPMADDIALPMPCGGSMIFRAVGTKAAGFLDDMQTLFGCDTCERRDNDYYERRYAAAVSGPFSRQDLPDAWQRKLPETGEENYYFFLIGKYEISDFQWKAVMDGWCPSEDAALSADHVRPKTGISWFDAMLFAKTYTEWLLQNAPDHLPRFRGDAKNIGYLRLPTESEWEYAARGGHAVPRASMRELEFFPMETGETLADYAVFRAEHGGTENVLPVGSRKANPLGLHDTAGNAAEMVLDNFRFSLGGRLHGSAGGFVRKGGSFFSSSAEILPGRREEAALFIADGANRARDMGARLVLSGINTPGGNRSAELKKEWEHAGSGSGLLLDRGKNPLEELDRLIAQSANPHDRENLARLRGILKNNNIALERQNAAAAEELIRNSLFMVETVRNYGVRHKSFVNMIASGMDERKQARTMSDAVRKAVEKTIAELEQNRAGMERSLDAALDFYRGKVEESLNYPEELFLSRLARIGAEFGGDDVLARNMRLAHELYSRHVGMLRRGERARLTRDLLLRDILPVNLREGLHFSPTAAK